MLSVLNGVTDALLMEIGDCEADLSFFISPSSQFKDNSL